MISRALALALLLAPDFVAAQQTATGTFWMTVLPPAPNPAGGIATLELPLGTTSATVPIGEFSDGQGNPAPVTAGAFVASDDSSAAATLSADGSSVTVTILKPELRTTVLRYETSSGEIGELNLLVDD